MALREVSAVDDALLIVDMQNDFVRPDGALPVPAAPAVVPVINRLLRRCAFRAVVVTRDWHPPTHASFRRPDGSGGPWPPHCVQGSSGAELHAGLHTAAATHIIHKGVRASAESYSAFADESGMTTGLEALLRGLGVRRVWICGVAYEYCVYYTAIDAVRAGFEVVVLQDATRAVDTAVVPARMLELQREGIVHVNSGVVLTCTCDSEECCGSCRNDTNSSNNTNNDDNDNNNDTNDNNNNNNNNNNKSSDNNNSSSTPSATVMITKATATVSTSLPC